MNDYSIRLTEALLFGPSSSFRNLVDSFLSDDVALLGYGCSCHGLIASHHDDFDTS